MTYQILFFSEFFWEFLRTGLFWTCACIETLTLGRSLLGVGFLCKMRGDLPRFLPTPKVYDSILGTDSNMRISLVQMTFLSEKCGLLKLLLGRRLYRWPNSENENLNFINSGKGKHHFQNKSNCNRNVLFVVWNLDFSQMFLKITKNMSVVTTPCAQLFHEEFM